MSDTPRTDNEEYTTALPRRDVVDAEFARTLEREAFAMRDAIKEAHEALKRMNEEWQYQAQLGNVPDNRVETGMVSTALAKLQPFIQ